mgnify:CR=1 FL=1
MLDIDGLASGYGARPVARLGHLTLAPGEAALLTGPSGSGKTTLLRLLAGFLAPSAGTIEFDGATVAGPAAWVPPERRRLGPPRPQKPLPEASTRIPSFALSRIFSPVFVSRFAAPAS